MKFDAGRGNSGAQRDILARGLYSKRNDDIELEGFCRNAEFSSTLVRDLPLQGTVAREEGQL
jgi:hypothetical protein